MTQYRISLRNLSLAVCINNAVVNHILAKDKIEEIFTNVERKKYLPPEISILPPANCRICTGFSLKIKFTLIVVKIMLTNIIDIETEYNKNIIFRLSLYQEMNEIMVLAITIEDTE